MDRSAKAGSRPRFQRLSVLEAGQLRGAFIGREPAPPEVLCQRHESGVVAAQPPAGPIRRTQEGGLGQGDSPDAETEDQGQAVANELGIPPRLASKDVHQLGVKQRRNEVAMRRVAKMSPHGQGLST